MAKLAFIRQQGQGRCQEVRVLRKLSYCAAEFPNACPYTQMFVILAKEEIKAYYENWKPCVTDLNIKGYF